MTALSTLTWWLTHAIVLCGALPLWPWLDAAPRAALIIGAAASLWQQRRSPWRLPDWLLNAAILPVFLYYLTQYRTSNAVQPVVSVLASMLALRLVSDKGVRHQLQIHALALFCLAASSLFDLTPTFLAYLTVFLLLEAPTLVLLTCQAQESGLRLARPDLRRFLAAGLILPLASLPLLVFFFPVLPRTRLPMWHLPAAPSGRGTGFSEKVQPGTSASQGVTREPVFRAEMPRLEANRLYWRVATFSRFDGSSWQRDPALPVSVPVGGANRVVQTIYLEGTPLRFLPGLDAPLAMEGIMAARAADGTYERLRGIGRRTSYRVESDPGGVLPARNRVVDSRWLELPESVSPRLLTLAGQVRRQGRDAAGRIERLEAYFRDNRFRYGMQGMPTGPRAIEEFLFERRQGNCEFFASAFAQLLRGAGIPARLVGGYLEGEYNRLGGYYLVGEERAHVWVEAFVAGEGWRRIDPSRFAVNAGDLWGGRRSTGLLERVRLALDAWDYYWNRNVVSYDFERQAEAAHRLGNRLSAASLQMAYRQLRPWLPLLVLLPLMGWLAWRRPGPLAPREERALRLYYRCLQRDCGIVVQPGRQGVFELAALSNSAAAREFADRYGAVVYRDQRLGRAEYSQLRAICRRGFRDGQG